MKLTLSGWRKLTPLSRQLSLEQGYLFAPVLVEDEAVGQATKNTLIETWREHAWPWREITAPLPFEGDDASGLRHKWLSSVDHAVECSSRGDILMLDYSSEPRHPVARDLMPWLNQRRETFIARGLRLIVLWPASFKEHISGSAPDLRSTRAVNPRLRREDLRPDADAAPEDVSDGFMNPPRVSPAAGQPRVGAA